jgi:pSer/pThr/pTyr-binding forkhead associated (FHA) protein
VSFWLPLEDEPIQLREWGTDRVYALPAPGADEWTIGASAQSWLHLQDNEGFVSRKHARILYGQTGWIIADAHSKNGLWLDGERQAEFPLTPGAEIGIGRLRLIVETPRVVRLRTLLARWLGWSVERVSVVDRALRAVRGFLAARSPLLLVADGDVVALAQRLHREALGAAQPFLVSDPRRGRSDPTPRSVENSPRSMRGRRVAAGGTLCVWAGRLPTDFAAMKYQSDAPGNRTKLVICAHTIEQLQALPGWLINVPPLSARPTDVDRIIEEYAAEAIAQFGAKRTSFTDRDRESIVARRPSSIPEIERAVSRLVAIREFGGVTRAAPRLGLSHTALSRWVARRVPRARRSEGEG